MHGLTARIGPSGFVVESSATDAPTVAVEVRAPDGTLAGAVYGAVTQSEADALVMRLSLGGDPGGPDVPWAAIARFGSDGLAASASMMMPSGLFWSVAGDELVVSTDPVSATRDHTVDPQYIREYVAGRTRPDATPFVSVRRSTSGATLTWTTPTSSAGIHVWCGPSVWQRPSLDGPAALATYLETFDAVVFDLAQRSRAPVTTVSGGLDSTFLAASLVRGADGPVRGLTYAPLPGAIVDQDADESALAMLMADRYPGELTVERVDNAGLVRPLAAAAEISRRSGVPTFTPANQPWLNRMREIAAADGSSMWFVGANGNAAFSYHHPYAADFYLRRARVDGLAELARDGGLRGRVLGPLRRQYLGSDSGPAMDRSRYLRWLARSVTGLPAAGNPAAMQGVLMADPFASRAVIEVAAAITPAEWARGPMARGFARRASAGRVPDAIRLRTGRGLQGRDAWFVIRHDKDDYLDRITALAGVAGLEEIDHQAMRARVVAWPWGSVQGPPWLDQIAVDRALGVAEFVSIW